MEWSVSMNMMKCSNCDAEFADELGDYTYGLYLDSVAMGYYGGFIDNFPPSESPAFWICHDCVVKVIEVLPKLREYLSGGHPNINWQSGDGDGTAYEPCCPCAWTWKDGQTYQVGKDGKWEKKYEAEL
jgi:hypothetical protein